MPTGLDQKPEIKQPLSKGRRLLPVLLLCCGLAAALCLWAVASARQSNAGPVPAPPPAQETPPASEPPRPTAPPEETVSTAPLYDFSQPAPEGGEAEEDYFSDAVFLGEHVRKYHKTLTTYLDGLLTNGFAIQRVVEPQPPEHMLHIEGMKDEMRRPMMLLVSARRD